MIGGRKSIRPASNPDVYAERANAALDIYNAEPNVPATAYAAVRSPLSTHGFATPSIGPKTRAFFKSNMWRLNGLIYNWAWGGTDMGKRTISTPGNGTTGLNGIVQSTQFQKTLVQLHDWQLNRDWYIAYNATGGGVFKGSDPIRYQYPSFRTPQPETRTSGGPGPVSMTMQPRPRFNRVQRITKYTARPRYYNTSSASGGRNSYGGSSNVNGPGSK
jgi:hypothetical protein